MTTTSRQVQLLGHFTFLFLHDEIINASVAQGSSVLPVVLRQEQRVATSPFTINQANLLSVLFQGVSADPGRQYNTHSQSVYLHCQNDKKLIYFN